MKNKTLNFLVISLGLIIFQSCDKSNITPINQEYLNKQVTNYVNKIETFHRVFVNQGYKELSNKKSYKNICEFTITHSSDLFLNTNSKSELKNLLKNEDYFRKSLIKLKDFSSKSNNENEYISPKEIRTITLELMNIVDKSEPSPKMSKDEFLDNLKKDLLAYLSNYKLKLVDELTLKSEIEILISSTKSWSSILYSNKANSWFSDAWNSVKGYAKADAVGGVINVLANSEDVVIAGVATGGSAALAVGAGLFVDGALIGSLTYALV